MRNIEKYYENTESEKPRKNMKVLTIKQPWATLIMQGNKR